MLGPCAAAALLLGIAACNGHYPQTTFAPTSEFGREVNDLFTTIFWWAVVVFVLVEAMLLFTVLKFRERPGSPEPKDIHGHTAMEIAWTLAPAVILIFVAVPTIKTIFKVDGSAPANALQVKVIGHQWWWEYQYPDLGVTTANELHLPQGKTAAIAITSADVIHSFWPPRQGGKRDAIPGKINRIAFTPDSTGIYLGQCAEFCGASHAHMGLRVVVEDSATFAQWVAQQKEVPPASDKLTGLVKDGAEAFKKIRDPADHSCIACHTVQGVAMGIKGPNLTHVGSRTTIAAGTLPMSTEGITRWLKDPPGVKPGSLMPNIGLTDQEITALAAYLQSLK
jgi:cytochrome c oxidase subunit 2